jgi:hypothetical protein
MQLGCNVPTQTEIMPSILKYLCGLNSDVPIREPVVKTYRANKTEAQKNRYKRPKPSAIECVELIVNLLEENPAAVGIDAADECKTARLTRCILFRLAR